MLYNDNMTTKKARVLMYLSGLALTLVSVACALLFLQGLPAWRFLMGPMFLLTFIHGAFWATLYHKENRLTWF